MVSDKIMSDKWPLRRVSTNIVNRSSSLAYSNLGRQPFKKELGIFWVFFFVFVFWLIIIQPWPSPGGEREARKRVIREIAGIRQKKTTTITYRSFPSTRYRPRDHLCRGRVPLGLYILRLEVPARSCSSSALLFFFYYY